jgi:acyl-CoA thioester hydrolase
MAEFNYEVEMEVRFRDIDAMGHVNNAVYSTYLEQARVEYISDVIGEEIFEGTGVVIADLHIDFERPIEYEESVVITVGAGELGSSSIPIEHEIRADGEVVATAKTLMVTIDRETGASCSMPDRWRERIDAHEGRQGTGE